MLPARLHVSVFILLLVIVTPAAAQSIPRSILLFEQSDIRGPFYYEIFSAFRSRINSEKLPTTIYTENLDLSRFSGVTYEESLRRHLQEKYRDKPIRVIVAIGDASLGYALRWRSVLWPDVPIAFAMVDETTIARLKPPSDVTGRIMKLSLADALKAARSVVPDLKRIVLVGDAWENQTVFRHWKDQIAVIAGDLEVSEMMGLTMRQLRQRVATLPPHTAIVYTAIYSDGEGTYYTPADALALLADSANRPIVVPAETNIGRGAIGGFVLTPSLIGESAAALALRILSGESASSIPITVGNYVRPVFDWRQLQRWGVKEAGLPADSEVRFREYSLWQQHFRTVLLVGAVLLLQTALITWLLYEHRRRHLAEITTRKSLAELAHMNRVSTAGELSASITHEINQPLGAIALSAKAASNWLEQRNFAQARKSLDQIASASLRAGEIIHNLRSMFGKATSDKGLVDINSAIMTVLSHVETEGRHHDVEIRAQLAEDLPPSLGVEIQLQQVILNLAMNAIEAMHSTPAPRVLTVKSELNAPNEVQVSIEDSGRGISPSDVPRVFQAMFTTKPTGMGMGLSICRSIVEAHGGRIWASPGSQRGSIFRFVLPTR
jgi:signal transduction histidine kinase